MKKLITVIISFVLILILVSFCLPTESKSQVVNNLSFLRDGDIVFQTSDCEQCRAVKLATHSKFNHCGIIFKENNKFFVYEAVQPVKVTALKDWIDQSNNGKIEIKRLVKSDSLLSASVVKKMVTYAKTLIGKNYDIYFGWNDDRIYCSEYVWKIYKNGANVEVGTLRKLKDFDLSAPEVKNILKQRYGKNIPYEETVISPADIYNSPKLISVQFSSDK